MKIGYARTSTLEQAAGLQAQEKELKAVGCEEIFKEQVSATGPRKELEKALAFTRKGDTLTVTKLDRLARSTTHLWQIVQQLQDKGAHLRVLEPDISTSSATGKLILTLMSGIAQFEREMMLERQREGIEKARREGKYKGRARTAEAKADEVWTLTEKGLGPSKIAQQLGIGRSSVYRILKQPKKS